MNDDPTQTPRLEPTELEPYPQPLPLLEAELPDDSLDTDAGQQDNNIVSINPQDFEALLGEVRRNRTMTANYLETVPLGQEGSRRLSPQEAQAVFVELQARGVVAKTAHEKYGFPVLAEARPEQPVSKLRKIGRVALKVAVPNKEVRKQAGEVLAGSGQAVARTARTTGTVARVASGANHRRKKTATAEEIKQDNLAELDWYDNRDTAVIFHPDARASAEAPDLTRFAREQAERRQQASRRAQEYIEIPGYKYVSGAELSAINSAFYPIFTDASVVQISRDITSAIKANLDLGIDYETAKTDAQDKVLDAALSPNTPPQVREHLLKAQLRAANLITKEAAASKPRGRGSTR